MSLSPKSAKRVHVFWSIFLCNHFPIQADSLIQPRGSSTRDYHDAPQFQFAVSMEINCFTFHIISGPSCRTNVELQNFFVRRRSHRTIFLHDLESGHGYKLMINDQVNDQVNVNDQVIAWEVNVCHAKHSWSVCQWVKCINVTVKDCAQQQ